VGESERESGFVSLWRDLKDSGEEKRTDGEVTDGRGRMDKNHRIRSYANGNSSVTLTTLH